MSASICWVIALLLFQGKLSRAARSPVALLISTPPLIVSTQDPIMSVTCIDISINLWCAIEARLPRNAEDVGYRQRHPYPNLNTVQLRPTRCPRLTVVQQRGMETRRRSERFICKRFVATKYRKIAALKIECEKTEILSKEDIKLYENLLVECGNKFTDDLICLLLRMLLVSDGSFHGKTCRRLPHMRWENQFFPKIKKQKRAAVAVPSATISTSLPTSKGLFSFSTSVTANQILLQTTTVTSQAVTSQAVTSPAVTSPAVTSPAVTSPALTSPAVTSPALTSPALTSPALTSPAVTSPALTSPAVTSPTQTTPEANTLQINVEPVSQSTINKTVEAISAQASNLAPPNSDLNTTYNSRTNSSSTRIDVSATDPPRSDRTNLFEFSATVTQNKSLKHEVGQTTLEIPLNNVTMPVPTNNLTAHKHNTENVHPEIDANELRGLMVLVAVTNLASRPAVWGAFIGLFFGSVAFVIVAFLMCIKAKKNSNNTDSSKSTSTKALDSPVSTVSLQTFLDNSGSPSHESGYTSYHGSADSHRYEMSSTEPSVHSRSVKSRRPSTDTSNWSVGASPARHDAIARSMSNPMSFSGATAPDAEALSVASPMSIENLITALSSQAGDKSVSLTITCSSLPRPKRSQRNNGGVSSTDGGVSFRRGVSMDETVDEDGYSHMIEPDSERARYLTIDENSDCGSFSTFGSKHEYDNFYEDNTGISEDEDDASPVIPRRLNRPLSVEGKNYVNVENYFLRSDHNRSSCV